MSTTFGSTKEKNCSAYTKLSVNSISSNVGFKSTLTFLRAFERSVHMTPSESTATIIDHLRSLRSARSPNTGVAQTKTAGYRQYLSGRKWTRHFPKYTTAAADLFRLSHPSDRRISQENSLKSSDRLFCTASVAVIPGSTYAAEYYVPSFLYRVDQFVQMLIAALLVPYATCEISGV